MFPPLPLESWKETKVTLHLYAQIVGKVRLGLHPPINHWWHAPLYVSARGLTTRAIPHDGGIFDLELDLIDHRLVLRTGEGATDGIELGVGAVADFCTAVMSLLARHHIDVEILAKPFDPDKVGSSEPFLSDREHAAYDRDSVHTFWRILSRIAPIFTEFRGRFLGKSSPVHLFWHSLDLAVTRFSGRRAPDMGEEVDPVTREAYSHEVISAGFWAGDDQVPAPAFYAYVHPEPKGLARKPLRPPGARWEKQNGSSLALWMYDDLRRSSDPRSALLEFLQCTYEAGADLSNWPRTTLE